MGEKKRNAEKLNREVDEVPVTYRVTWESFDDAGEHIEKHTKDFTDIDQGYDFYQHRLKSRRSYNATWEHVRGD